MPRCCALAADQAKTIATGAQRGIGYAIASCFAADGAFVVIADINDASDGVATLREAGYEASFIQTDVSSEADVGALIDKVVGRYGRVDVLINNAGLSLPRPW